MSKNKKNKGNSAVAEKETDQKNTTSAVANNTAPVQDKDQVEDKTSKKKSESINFSAFILQLKDALVKAGFKQSEIKSQKFVFEVEHNGATHRICSISYAQPDSRRKTFFVIVGVKDGLTAKPFLSFFERGAATSGSRPAHIIKVNRETFEKVWKENGDQMITDIIAVIQEASKIRTALMDESAKADSAKKEKKVAAEKKEKAEKASKASTDESEGSEDPDEKVVEEDEDLDLDPENLDDNEFDDELDDDLNG